MYYIHQRKLKKLAYATSEGELYGMTDYGCGETVFEFQDGSFAFARDCFEISFDNFKVQLWMAWIKWGYWVGFIELSSDDKDWLNL